MKILLLNPYTLVVIIMTVLYVYAMYVSSNLIYKLQQTAALHLPWSNRQKFKVVKALSRQAESEAVKRDAKRLLFYMNLGAYTVYIGFAVMLVIIWLQ